MVIIPLLASYAVVARTCWYSTCWAQHPLSASKAIALVAHGPAMSHLPWCSLRWHLRAVGEQLIFSIFFPNTTHQSMGVGSFELVCVVSCSLSRLARNAEAPQYAALRQHSAQQCRAMHSSVCRMNARRILNFTSLPSLQTHYSP